MKTANKKKEPVRGVIMKGGIVKCMKSHSQLMVLYTRQHYHGNDGLELTQVLTNMYGDGKIQIINVSKKG